MGVRRQETHILSQIAGDSPNPDAAIAAFFMEKPKEVARLTRYIASFENAFYRAMNKLEKLQKERRAAEEQAAIEAAELEALVEQQRKSADGFVSKSPQTASDSPSTDQMPQSENSRMYGQAARLSA